MEETKITEPVDATNEVKAMEEAAIPPAPPSEALEQAAPDELAAAAEESPAIEPEPGGGEYQVEIESKVEVVASEEVPVVEETPVVEEAPVVEMAAVVDETPVVEEAPVVEMAPVEETPAPVEALEEAPAPVEVEAVAVEETPAPVEEASVQVEAAPAEEAPAPVEAVEAAPVEEEKPKRKRKSKKEAVAETVETVAAPEGEAAVVAEEVAAEEAPAEVVAEEAAVEVAAEETPSEPTAPVFAMDADVLASTVESLLFVAEKPITINRLKEAFLESECPTEEAFQAALATIQARHENSASGFELRHAQGGYHFVTKVENAEYIRRFQASKPFRLGRSALEVLAIIAYRQPITRAEIDQVRGIDSSHLMRVLMERGMVKMGGKAEVPGRPVTYMTTDKFLEIVGLSSVQELPPLSELDQLQGNTEDPIKKLEKNLDRVMAESTAEIEENPDQAESELGQIDTLIQSAHEIKEVYGSSEAQECAQENQVALECFQAETRTVRRIARKNVVRFEDLQAAPVIEVIPPEDAPIN